MQFTALAGILLSPISAVQLLRAWFGLRRDSTQQGTAQVQHLVTSSQRQMGIPQAKCDVDLLRTESKHSKILNYVYIPFHSIHDKPSIPRGVQEMWICGTEDMVGGHMGRVWRLDSMT